MANYSISRKIRPFCRAALLVCGLFSPRLFWSAAVLDRGPYGPRPLWSAAVSVRGRFGPRPYWTAALVVRGRFDRTPSPTVVSSIETTRCSVRLHKTLFKRTATREEITRFIQTSEPPARHVSIQAVQPVPVRRPTRSR